MNDGVVELSEKIGTSIDLARIIRYGSGTGLYLLETYDNVGLGYDSEEVVRLVSIGGEVGTVVVEPPVVVVVVDVGELNDAETVADAEFGLVVYVSTQEHALEIREGG